MRLDKSEKRAILIFTVILLALIALNVIAIIRWRVDNTKQFVTNITVEDRPEDKGEKNNLKKTEFIAMEKSKSWISQLEDGRKIVGAEYDGTIYNNSGKNIVNWTMTIYMPNGKDGHTAEGTIDSSWNGQYTENGDTIYFVPEDYLNKIPKNENKTFGFVMYSDKGLDFTDFEFSGYYETILLDYSEFWISVIGFFGWVIFLAAWLITNSRTRKLRKQKEHDEKIIEETMQMFANFIDAKDPYTKGHSTRVGYYCRKIAERMGMNEEEAKVVGYMGLMHDCGKIGIPENILNKTGSLSNEERDIIKNHTIRGGEMLESFTSIPGIRDGALYHHERYDGKGYPYRLVGKEIPLYARIINVADAFDAMNSDRVYRKRLSKEKILSELRSNAGTQFDPEIAEEVIAMYQEGKLQ